MNIGKLRRSPLVSCSIIVEMVPSRSFRSADYAEFARKNGADTFSLLRERNVEIKEEGDSRIEHVVENRAAGVSFQVEDKTDLILKPSRVECRIRREYSTWEDFVGLALPHMRRAIEFSAPLKITAVIIRSLNKIVIKESVLELSDIVNALPAEVCDSKGLCLDLHHKDTQYYRQYDAFATVSKDYQRKKGIRPDLILAIDVMKVYGVEGANKFDEGVFSQLRKLKDEIFFNTLTPAQLNQYK